MFPGQQSVGAPWGKSHVSCLGPSGNEARASLEGKLFAFNTFAIQAFCEVSQESDATGLQGSKGS